jgi:hypothetical protein
MSQSQNHVRFPEESSQHSDHYTSPQSSFGNAASASPQNHISINDQYIKLSDNASQSDRTKSKYILKEQKRRAKILEEETRQVLKLPGTSQVGFQRDYSLSLQLPNADSVDTHFEEGDWTQQDSSYGGAFPFCGWIPKRIRQCTESILLVVAGFATIYFIVTVAIKLTGSGGSSSKSSTYDLNDDHYIAAGNDDAEYATYNAYYDDDDDLYNGDNAVVYGYSDDDDGGRKRNFFMR